jgi:Trypsin-like peptidase domain
MTEILTRGLIQVLRPNGSVAGTGFLTSADWAVTCTHVLAEDGAAVGSEVAIKLYGASAPLKAVLDPKYWRPADAEDVAFLRLTTPVADGAALPLGSSNGTNRHEFDTFGFPSINADGGCVATGMYWERLTSTRFQCCK